MNLLKSSMILLGLALSSAAAFALELPGSIDALCEKSPERIQSLFTALNLDLPELAEARSAAADGRWPEACRALLHHYDERFRESASASDALLSEPRLFDADRMFEDRFTFYGVEDVVPRRADGGLDWHWRGPTDDPEWAWGLNRHFYMATLLDAYRASGRKDCVRLLDELIQDWVLSNPYPGEKSKSAPWRGLEAALRMKSWRRLFVDLREEDGFSPAARLLMLSSLPDHAHYLRHFHAAGNNWLTMEMNGLAIIATLWPEFLDSGQWLDYAVDQLVPALDEQVLPDGAQTELTSHYHWVALMNFQEFANTITASGRSLPNSFQDRLAAMWNYTAWTMRPNGHGLLNNDADYDFNRSRIAARAAQIGETYWEHIASNGKGGAVPPRPPSIVFPWAGHAILRSGFEADAHWAYFDMGPLGTGHVHYDKLHLSMSPRGRDVLVDSGRYSYVGGPWRDYFTGSSSHNIILIDGNGYKSYPGRAETPLSGLLLHDVPEAAAPLPGYLFPERLGNEEQARANPDYIVSKDFTYFRGRHQDGYRGVVGRAAHTRVVLRMQDSPSLTVLDYIDTSQPRDLTVLWHFHPDCEVTEENGVLTARIDGAVALRIAPLAKTDWTFELVKGRETPQIQGWYSPIYNTKIPAYAAVGTTRIEESALFGWQMDPSEDCLTAPPSLQSNEDGWAVVGAPINMDIPMAAEGAPKTHP